MTGATNEVKIPRVGLEIFEYTKGRATGIPNILIRSGGQVLLNKEATAPFERNKATNILLLWDKDERTFAIAEAPKTDPRSYKLSYSRRVGAKFSAMSFLRHIKWTPMQSVSLRADFVKGMLQAKIPAEFLKASEKDSAPEKKRRGLHRKKTEENRC